MSIFDTIGGAPTVSVAVDKFYERVLSDPQLAHYFDKVDMDKLKSHQRAFIAAAIGGPNVYRGRDMATAHAKLGITAQTSMPSREILWQLSPSKKSPMRSSATSATRLLPYEPTSSACPHLRPAANQVRPRRRRDR